MTRVLYKVALRFLRHPLWIASPAACTRFTSYLLRKLGARISGVPNYLSAKVWFDGSDYSLISIGHGATISSNVRILTHDWSPYTAARAILGDEIAPKGPIAPVVLKDYAFVGTGAVILPGTVIGRGTIVGAGAVVKGDIPDGAIVVGNPAKVIGSANAIVKKYYG